MKLRTNFVHITGYFSVNLTGDATDAAFKIVLKLQTYKVAI